MNKTKLALGTVAAGVTATGWGLYGAKATEPSKTLTVEETTPMVSPMQPLVIPPQPITLTLANDSANIQHAKQVEELSGIIDTKNEQLKKLEDEVQYFKQRVDNFTKNFGNVYRENFRLKDEIAVRKRLQESQTETIKYLLDNNEELYQASKQLEK